MITYFIIAANILAFLVRVYFEISGYLDWFYNSFAMIPALIIQGEQLYTLLTAMFVHGDIFHILSNMLYLYIFGNNVEDSMGSGRFVIFYLLCGVLASFAHILIDPTSKIPTLGASGAVSGVLGAYLVMYPRERVDALIGYFLIRVRAVVVLLSWFALQLLYGILSLGQTGQGGVAFFAHIGGFIAGALLIFIFRKRQKAQW